MYRIISYYVIWYFTISLYHSILCLYTLQYIAFYYIYITLYCSILAYYIRDYTIHLSKIIPPNPRDIPFICRDNFKKNCKFIGKKKVQSFRDTINSKLWVRHHHKLGALQKTKVSVPISWTCAVCSRLHACPVCCTDSSSICPSCKGAASPMMEFDEPTSRSPMDPHGTAFLIPFNIPLNACLHHPTAFLSLIWYCSIKRCHT